MTITDQFSLACGTWHIHSILDYIHGWSGPISGVIIIDHQIWFLSMDDDSIFAQHYCFSSRF